MNIENLVNYWLKLFAVSGRPKLLLVKSLLFFCVFFSEENMLGSGGNKNKSQLGLRNPPKTSASSGLFGMPAPAPIGGPSNPPSMFSMSTPRPGITTPMFGSTTQFGTFGDASAGHSGNCIHYLTLKLE